VLREQRDAEARLDADAHAVERQLLRQLVAHAAEQLERLGLAAHVGQDQPELVAAQPRDRVVGAQGLAQALGDDAQHLVAGVVAEGVVHLLEAVEVRQHDRAPLGRAQRALGAQAERLAVRQCGQRVVQRLALARGGVAAQAAGRRPGDDREHEVQPHERPGGAHVRVAQLRLDLGCDRLVRQVELEDAGRLPAGVRDDRLQDADHLRVAADRIRHDRDVLPAARRPAEAGAAGLQRAGGGAVVREHDSAGEAAQPQAHHGA
jgi:hypothetical protein